MDKDQQSSDPASSYLPLPTEGNAAKSGAASDPAVNFARQKVNSALGQEPSAAAEALDVQELGSALHQSRHQKFIYELTNSGKSLEEIQTAWHDYYAALPDKQKHQVWQEFYAAHNQAQQLSQNLPVAIETVPAIKEDLMVAHSSYQPPRKLPKKARELKEQVSKTLPIPPALRPKRQLKSLLVGLGAGVLTVLILLFSFFNERFIAPLIQPSRNVSNIQLIDNSSVSNAPEVIIPKINVEIPVVYGVNTIDDNAVNAALEQGVVHYADTAVPGQKGNVVIVGHSSNNILNSGKYKFAFVLLHKLETGDIFYLQKDGARYTYQVINKKIVKPTDVSVLASSEGATASLITCDPPGTSNNRLVVTGTQIAPDPAADTAQVATNALATESKIIPGNSPTLWSRISHWLSE